MTTISTQRGATVVSGMTTLFTNSGSVNATRVITNGIVFNNYGYTGGCNVGGEIIVCPSGGIGYHIGIAGNTGCGAGILGNQAYHDNRIIPGMWQNTQAPPTPASYTNGSGVNCCWWQPVPISGGNYAACGAAPGSLQLAQPYFTCGNAGCPAGSLVCQPIAMSSMVPQFWLGASDSVKAYPRGGSCSFYFVAQGKGGYGGIASCGSVYAGYSFTLVSE